MRDTPPKMGGLFLGPQTISGCGYLDENTIKFCLLHGGVNTKGRLVVRFKSPEGVNNTDLGTKGMRYIMI